MKKINHLFSDCKNIEYIDFTNFNTENVLYMKGMFKKCNN